MTIKRRLFLRSAAAAGMTGFAMLAGALAPMWAWAARPQAAFDANKFDDTMSALFGQPATESGDIEIKAPDIAENGAVVPVTVQTTIPGAESVSIIVQNNPNPLAASFALSPASGGLVSTRVKMAKTSPVHVVVKAGDKVYRASKEVKVTIGGCGG